MTDPKPWMRTAAEKIREAVVALSWASDGDFVPSVAALIAESAPTAPSGEEIAWLIEGEPSDGGTPKFMTLDMPAKFGESLAFDWARQADRAVRFARRADAEAFVRQFLNDIPGIAVVEHMWCEAALSRPTAETQPAPAGDLRAAFEAFARTHKPSPPVLLWDHYAERYKDDSVHFAWRAYQAAQSGRPAMTEEFIALLHRQMRWSLAMFGPGPRSAGNIDHIRKELREIEAAPQDLEEWVDVAMLAFDGAWREGHSPEAILAAWAAKHSKNECRKWPDWRTADPDKAIEHDRLGAPQ